MKDQNPVHKSIVISVLQFASTSLKRFFESPTDAESGLLKKFISSKYVDKRV